MHLSFRVLILVSALLWQSCGSRGLQPAAADGCDGYDDPSTSKYILPYQVGTAIEMGQGNCGPFTHWGIVRYAYDFGIDNNVTIIAVRAGTVIQVEMNASNDSKSNVKANVIGIEHADGTVAEYVHLFPDSQKVSVGDSVVQGQEIAENGASGTYSPHLHFQVYRSKARKQTIPVTFRNTDKKHPNGLQTGETYEALAFTPNDD